MIVVDSNVLAALLLPTATGTEAAIKLLRLDRDWVAPLLWRSELTNILATGTRNGWFDFEQAVEALSAAEEIMAGGEFRVPAHDVLRIANLSECNGYDSEYVVLAQDLGIRLVTLDRQVLKAFPDTAVSLETYDPEPAT